MRVYMALGASGIDTRSPTVIDYYRLLEWIERAPNGVQVGVALDLAKRYYPEKYELVKRRAKERINYLEGSK